MTINLVEKMLAITLLGSEWVLWLLLILSVLSLAVAFERGFYFYKMRIDFPMFMQKLTELIVRRDSEGIKSLCEKSPAVECQVLLRALQQEPRGSSAMQDMAQGYLLSERSQMDRGLVILGTLGNNAPFIGLFGTVIGIIIAFHNLSQNPAGGPSVVMAGISEALIATAVGLIVAIPAVIAYNIFQRIVKTKISNAQAVLRLLMTHYGG